MARVAKSVVLSKAEIKAAVVATKAQIKATKEARKGIEQRRKDADKVFQAATKANVLVLKTTDKELAANAKLVAGLEAKLASYAPAAPVVAA